MRVERLLRIKVHSYHECFLTIALLGCDLRRNAGTLLPACTFTAKAIALWFELRLPFSAHLLLLRPAGPYAKRFFLRELFNPAANFTLPPLALRGI